MNIRRPVPLVWLAAFAAAAATACATQPATAPSAKPVVASAPASSAPLASTKASSPSPSSGATAAASVSTPPAAFAICSACHGVTASAPPGLGPNLFGVVGRKAGSLADYDYSPAMKASGKVWTAEALQGFVLDPSKAVPGNKMDYDGAADAATAKAIAVYVASLK